MGVHRNGVFMSDYFPLEDFKLKALSCVPFEEYLLRGDFVSMNSGLLPQTSKYFLEDEEVARFQAKRALLEEKLPKGAAALSAISKAQTQDQKLRALTEGPWIMELNGKTQYNLEE